MNTFSRGSCVGSPAHSGLFSSQRQQAFRMLGGTRKQWEWIQTIPLLHLLSLWFYLMLHAPVKALLRAAGQDCLQGPLQPPLLPWSSGGQHMGTSRGPLTMDSCSISKAVSVRRMPVFLESHHVFVFLKVIVLSHIIFAQGYYYFFYARLSIRFF